MKKTLLLSFALGTFFTSQAQETEKLSNSCATDFIQQNMIKEYPEIISNMEEFEKVLKQQKQLQTARSSSTVYTIPVVVHVMHKGEPIGTDTNISDDVVVAKIRSINEIYRKIAGTSVSSNSPDIGIQFALAVVDPSGNPTTGITRFDMTSNTTYMNFGVKATTNNGISDASLKALVIWDPTLYYNIWVVSEVDNNNGGQGVQAYAQYASSHGKPIDGTVILAKSMKNLEDDSAPHELGHALNLYHTFNGDNPSNDQVTLVCPSSDPTLGDFCADTPAHKRTDADCSLSTANSCYPSNTDLSFINNFMSYSLDACRNTFTPNQRDRMITALTTIRQSFLSSASTNKLVPITAPVADFAPSEPFLTLIGTDLKLNDKSLETPNIYLYSNNWPNMTFDWTINSNSVSLTSSDQNPKFVITEPGIFNVSHTVNNGLGENTKTAANIIYACNPLTVLPSNTLTSTSSSTAGQLFRSFSFKNIDITTNTNTNQPYLDLSNTNNALIFAGQTYPLSITIKALGGYAEYSSVYLDYNNNGTFEESEKIATNNIPVNTNVTTFVSNVTIPTTATQNTLLRMRVAGNARDQISNDMINGKAPFYIGDVKDFGVYIADASMALATQDFTTNNISYYPNPVNNLLNINNSDKIEKIEIYNLMGQLLLSKDYNDSQISVDLSQLQTGTYIASIYANNKRSSVKILKN